MFTRQEFARRRAVAEQVLRRDGGVLAVVSVGLGVAQIILIRWAERHLARRPELRLEGGVFLAYMALVGLLAWRFYRKLRIARPICPHCGVPLEDMSLRLAAATGRCDSCGGQVIE